MEISNSDVLTIEKLVRAIVSEVFRTQSASPSAFRSGQTLEKRVAVRAGSVSAPPQTSVPAQPSAPPQPSVPAQPSAPPQPSVPAQPSAPPQPSAPALVSAPNPLKRLKPDELLLDRQVVTLRDVAHLPRTVKRLIVPQTALLTPSVRDELDEQQIRLARYSAEAIAAFQTDPSQTRTVNSRTGALEVYALFTPYHPESLFPTWTRSGWHPNLRSGFVCFDGLRGSMTKNETLNVLFTSRVDEALCRLHRDEKIRAIHSANPEKLSAQWKDFPSANTLIVNPSEVGLFLAGQLVMRAAELFYHS